MPRKKKSIKQTGLQNVVQTVKVIVGGKSKRRAGRRRATRAEPALETISARTLAPVFIQPPVASQQMPYDFQEVGKSIAETAFRTLYDKLPISTAKPTMKTSDMQTEATPSMKTYWTQTDAVPSHEPAEPFVFGDVIEPEAVVLTRKKSKPSPPPSALENPTTSVDSMYAIDETTGFVSDKNPTADTNIFAPPPSGFDVEIGTQDAVNNFDEDPSRDISAFVENAPPVVKEKKKRVPSGKPRKLGKLQEAAKQYEELFGYKPSYRLDTAEKITKAIERSQKYTEIAKKAPETYRVSGLYTETLIKKPEPLMETVTSSTNIV